VGAGLPAGFWFCRVRALTNAWTCSSCREILESLNLGIPTGAGAVRIGSSKPRPGEMGDTGDTAGSAEGPVGRYCRKASAGRSTEIARSARVALREPMVLRTMAKNGLLSSAGHADRL